MNPTIEVTKADRIPADAHVSHYDELTGDAKTALPDAVAHGTADVPWQAAEQFASIDVVKYTSYYHVAVTELSETTDRTGTSTTGVPPIDPLDRTGEVLTE